MSVPDWSTGDFFHDWAQLPIPREQFDKEYREQQKILFPKSAPLPGAEKLVQDLRYAGNVRGEKVYMALASGSETVNFHLKTQRPEVKRFIVDAFPEELRVLGDDPRVKHGRGKPAPDIFNVALDCLNNYLPESEPQIKPNECLVFEDSVFGVEAARRAGMKVVWVPHVGIGEEYKDKADLVLAGRTGAGGLDQEKFESVVGDDGGVQLDTLENFPYHRFGLRTGQSGSESTTGSGSAK